MHEPIGTCGSLLSAKPLSLISLIVGAPLAQQGPESAQAGSHPQGPALETAQKAMADVCMSPRVPGLFGWAESAQARSYPQETAQKAVADVCTSPRVPGLFGWAGCVHRHLMAPLPHALPPLVPGLGTHRGCGRSKALCKGSGLGAGH